MFYLLLAVTCSVAVSVLLKVAARRQIDIAQAVTWNYLVTTSLTALLLRPSLQGLDSEDAPWAALLALAVLLPGLFLVLARAVAIAGIVRSDAAQRLSLLLSLVAAFTLFGEQANGLKLAGLGIGLLAIAGISVRPVPTNTSTSTATTSMATPRGWPWLLMVWMGFALVDIMLKEVALSGTPSMAALLVSFGLAFMLMFAWQLWRHLRGTARLGLPSLWAGLLLGTLNFGNIFCYVRAHQAMPESPAVVFAGMNIGVVALGTLVGMAVFAEPVRRWNRVGLALAVAAIALIALGTARG